MFLQEVICVRNITLLALLKIFVKAMLSDPLVYGFGIYRYWINIPNTNVIFIKMIRLEKNRKEPSEEQQDKNW